MFDPEKVKRGHYYFDDICSTDEERESVYIDAVKASDYDQLLELYRWLSRDWIQRLESRAVLETSRDS